MFFCWFTVISLCIVFFSIAVAASTPDVDHVVLIMIAFFLVIVLIHILVMPFKTYIDNAAHSLTYLSLLAILITNYVLSTSDESLELVIWQEIALSLLPLSCAILFCTWKLFTLARIMWSRRRLNASEMVKDYIMLCYLYYGIC